jgi:hypothetical protein
MATLTNLAEAESHFPFHGAQGYMAKKSLHTFTYSSPHSVSLSLPKILLLFLALISIRLPPFYLINLLVLGPLISSLFQGPTFTHSIHELRAYRRHFYFRDTRASAEARSGA